LRRAKEWQDFHLDAAGAFRLTLHRRSRFDLAVYLAARLADDLQATALGKALDDLVKAAAESRLPDCLVCGAPLSWLPPIIITMLAERPDPSTIMSSGICPACAEATDAEILSRAEAVLRRVWPDLRVLDMSQVHPTGGRA
jgi:hypothetical protein